MFLSNVVTLGGVGSVPDRRSLGLRLTQRPAALNTPLGAYIMFSHQSTSEHFSEWKSKAAIWSRVQQGITGEITDGELTENQRFSSLSVELQHNDLIVHHPVFLFCV